MAINLPNNCYKEQFDRIKSMLTDDRALGEIEDAIKMKQTTEDIIYDDVWEGNILINGDYVTLDVLLDCIEGVIAYEHGYEGNDYWRETFK